MNAEDRIALLIGRSIMASEFDADVKAQLRAEIEALKAKVASAAPEPAPSE